jgi:hypothetical protein
MRLSVIFFAVCVGAGAIGTPVATLGNTQQVQIEEALANLRSSDAEWRREYKIYRAKRRANALSPAEADEYAEFVASLQKQKLENCEIARQLGGNKAIEGFDCLKSENAGKSAAEAQTAVKRAQTKTEKVEALEARLKQLEAELDEELSKKQQIYRERAGYHNADRNAAHLRKGTGEGRSRRGRSATESGNSNWGPVPEEEQGKSSVEAGEEAGELSKGAKSDTTDEQGAAMSKKGPGHFDPGAGPGDAKEEKAPRVAKGAPEEGDDDDIVMRQLREAAEQETDPILKEKLWAEYRKLKAARAN